jgi:hypothetical protein
MAFDRTSNISAHNHYDIKLKVRVRAEALDTSALLTSYKQVSNCAFFFMQQQPVNKYPNLSVL